MKILFKNKKLLKNNFQNYRWSNNKFTNMRYPIYT